MTKVDKSTGEILVVGPFLRTPYNYDRDAASDVSALRCDDVSLAVQDARDETDINTIVRRFGLTGQLPSEVRAPQYGDFTHSLDYHSALNAVIAADDSFMALPADVRARFKNDAGSFVDFCSDPKNQDEAEKLGLTFKVPPKDPIAVRVMADASAAGSGAPPVVPASGVAPKGPAGEK